jgi:hypothetical protein
MFSKQAHEQFLSCEKGLRKNEVLRHVLPDLTHVGEVLGCSDIVVAILLTFTLEVVVARRAVLVAGGFTSIGDRLL